MKTIIQEIEYAIMAGEFRPKQRLVENDLAQRFSVGRGTIRESLKILTHRGLVCRSENRGSTVRELSAKEIRDLYCVRSYLEGIAAELAFTKITPKDIKEMSRFQEQLKSYPRVDRGTIKLHEGFHEIIFRAAGNDFLFNQISGLIVLSGAVRYFSYAHPDQRRRVLNEHDQIIMSFESGNKKEFVELCRNHVFPGMMDYISLFYPHESIEIGNHPVSSKYPFLMSPIGNQKGEKVQKNRMRKE